MRVTSESTHPPAPPWAPVPHEHEGHPRQDSSQALLVGQTGIHGMSVPKDGLDVSLGRSVFLSTEYRGTWDRRIRDLRSIQLKGTKSSLNMAIAAAV